MTGHVVALVQDYLTLRRGLGYRSPVRERALRAFARYLDDAGHDGLIPLEASLDWVAATTSTDPCNPAHRLASVRGFGVSPVRPGRPHRSPRAGPARPADLAATRPE